MQIDRIADLPGLRQVVKLPLVSSLIAAFLPTLVLRLFLLVLPYLLAYMGTVEGLVSFSAVEFSVVTKLFTFQARFTLFPKLLALARLSHLSQNAKASQGRASCLRTLSILPSCRLTRCNIGALRKCKEDFYQWSDSFSDALALSSKVLPIRERQG